ncbi:hypothetical protein Hdeb2414_s0020g00552241 [Helianthus debilis subsp. tardiflorus]
MRSEHDGVHATTKHAPTIFHRPLGFASNMNIKMGGTYGSQEEAEPEIETVPETQAEREPKAP